MPYPCLNRGPVQLRRLVRLRACDHPQAFTFEEFKSRLRRRGSGLVCSSFSRVAPVTEEPILMNLNSVVVRGLSLIMSPTIPVDINLVWEETWAPDTSILSRSLSMLLINLSGDRRRRFPLTSAQPLTPLAATGRPKANSYQLNPHPSFKNF